MASYLEWIRKHVGRQRLLMVYASGCVQDAAGQLLWQRRADFGWWGLPGGVLELDEDLPGCLVREVLEETGLEVEPIRLVGVYSSPDYHVVYPNGDQVQQVTFCFACRPIAGSLRADGQETLDLRWFPSDFLPTTAPWYRDMARDLLLDLAQVSFDRGSPGQRDAGPPYYQQVRRHVGKAPIVMPAGAAFVQDHGGRVLLIRHHTTGRWALPGGAMELGERIDQTVVAEVLEETGLDVEPVRLVGVYSDDRYWMRYPNGDELKLASILFECRLIGGQLRADGTEVLEAAFFPVDSLPSLDHRHETRLQDALAGLPCPIF